MKVLICGDRNWTDRKLIHLWLCELQKQGDFTVIEGEARGADTLAKEEAEALGIPVMKFPANWGKYHRAAGIIRNRQMLDQMPDLILAFHTDLSRSKGTADTVREARRRGIETIVVEEGGDIDGEDK